MPLDISIPRTDMTSPQPIAAMYLFGSFRSSERKKLLKLSSEKQDVFLSALADFLDRWATADWLEEYNVERVGRWIAKTCPKELSLEVKRSAEQKKPANSVEPGSIPIRTYQAFLRGLEAPQGC